MPFFSRDLSTEKIAELVKTVSDLGDAEQYSASWDAAKPLRKALSHQSVAAEALCGLVRGEAFELERRLELAEQIVTSYPNDLRILSEIGDNFQALHDVRYLNAAPPENPTLIAVGEKLQALAQVVDGDDEYLVLNGLSHAARILGRGWDEVSEAAYLRLLDIRPERWQLHYSYGLFLKTRGRFQEGQTANQRAQELAGEDVEVVIWNLGICATGARDGETALRIWKEMGQNIEMGRLGLPEGGYPSIKVRLAERPLAERTPGDDPNDPGVEETVWVERVSPCHGVVRSALFYDIGVDYGDVVLFDGNPITYHSYGDEQVSVFPHLATLATGNYQIFRFGATQPREGYIDSLGEQLQSGIVVYVHTEQFQLLCSSCWESTALDHAEHVSEQHRIVTGKVCAPPELAPSEIQTELDALFSSSEAQLYVPELSRACGDERRADVEERRLRMIEQAG